MPIKEVLFADDFSLAEEAKANSFFKYDIPEEGLANCTSEGFASALAGWEVFQAGNLVIRDNGGVR